MSNSLEASLLTWPALNARLKVASEKECQQLLRQESRGKRRLQFMLRIYGRYNRLRAERERRGLFTEGKVTL